jgi:ribonuclease Y
MDITFIIIAAVAGLVIGGLIAYLVTKKNNQAIIATAEEKANAIIKEAHIERRNTFKDKTMEAKDRFYQMKRSMKSTLQRKTRIFSRQKIALNKKKTSLNQQIEQNKRKQGELETLQSNLTSQLEVVTRRKDELDKAHHKQVQALEKIAGLSADDAKAQLVEALKAEAKTEAMQYIKESMDEAKLTASKEAKNCYSNHSTCCF